MRLKLLVAVAALIFSASSFAQVRPAGERSKLNLSAGGGLDYFWGDWGGAVKRLGPSAWVSAEIWHGIGVQVEGHAMDFGGSTDADDHYKYYSGQGGLTYTYHHWRKIRPFAKGEIGYASLSFPDTGIPYQHQDERIWEVGGGAEYHTYRHLWTRVDYSYDFFPNFYSPLTGQFHYLNPSGITFGETYHFR